MSHDWPRIREKENGELDATAGASIHDAVKAAIAVAVETKREQTLVFNDLRLKIEPSSDVNKVCSEYFKRSEERAREAEIKRNRKTILEWEYAQRDARAALIEALELSPRQSRLLAQEIREAFAGATEITEGMHRIMRLGVEIEQ